MAIARTERTGTIMVDAKTRVTTKYLKGLVPDTSMASICSVTRIEPNSAPMPEPILPAQINEVTTGVISRTSEIDTIAGSKEAAPNSTKVGRD